jgi:hypothetical protein
MFTWLAQRDMSKIFDNQPKTAAVSITTTLQDEQSEFDSREAMVPPYATRS